MSSTGLKTSGGPILTSGLNSTDEWGLYGKDSSGTITMKTNSAPILIVWPLGSGATGSTYDGENVSVTGYGARYGSWGLSYAYVPSDSNELSIRPTAYGLALFHGDKQFNYKLETLIADHDGYVFIFSAVIKSYVTSIKKNDIEIKNDVLEDVSQSGTGWGMSYAAIPVVTGDKLDVTINYDYAVIY